MLPDSSTDQSFGSPVTTTLPESCEFDVASGPSGGHQHGAAETFVHHRHDPEVPDSLSDNQVTAIAEHAAGHLWVGTFHGGLNRLDTDGEFTVFLGVGDGSFTPLPDVLTGGTTPEAVAALRAALPRPLAARPSARCREPGGPVRSKAGL